MASAQCSAHDRRESVSSFIILNPYVFITFKKKFNSCETQHDSRKLYQAFVLYYENTAVLRVSGDKYKFIKTSLNMSSNPGCKIMKTIILLSCGSFNPVTNMHLRIFEIAKDALHKTGMYSVQQGIISPVNDGYKKLTTKKLESASHRVAMATLAVQSSDWIRVDDWESKQSCWTTTVNVLEHITEDIKKIHSNASVKLLCGADLLESFAVPGLWKNEDIESIVRDYGMVVITRAGSDPENFIYESDVLTQYKNNIFIVKEWMFNDISSTKVRRSLLRNESIRYIVPDDVVKYIKTNSLYK